MEAPFGAYCLSDHQLQRPAVVVRASTAVEAKEHHGLPMCRLP